MTDEDSGWNGRWRNFWFRPEPAYSLGLIRMVFGLLVLWWSMSLIPDLYLFFGDEGVAGPPVPTLNGWGLFAWWSGDRALLLGWAALVVAALMLVVGWRSRIAALTVFVLVVSFEHRTTFVFNAGDGLIRVEALYLMLAPCGAALSLDRRRVGEPFWSAESHSPWIVRLMQVQLSLIYLSSVVTKMRGETWPGGTAVSYALRLDDMLKMATPQWLWGDALLMNAATWATLVIELAIGVLVWIRRLRPWVLAAGVGMHLMITTTIDVGFFTPAMFVLYLAFLPPERVSRLPQYLRSIAVERRFPRRMSAETSPESAHPRDPERRAEA